jgi:hypothetical protein
MKILTGYFLFSRSYGTLTLLKAPFPLPIKHDIKTFNVSMKIVFDRFAILKPVKPLGI